MALLDTPWGRLEPGHYTRNLDGFVLSVYRVDGGWVRTIDGFGPDTLYGTMRDAKQSAEHDAGRSCQTCHRTGFIDKEVCPECRGACVTGY
jgi:hypothetical protein